MTSVQVAFRCSILARLSPPACSYWPVRSLGLAFAALSSLACTVCLRFKKCVLGVNWPTLGICHPRQASCCSRSRGLKVCDRWLRVHGLPGTKRGRVQWPKLVPRRVFNGCLRAVKTQLLQSCHPVVAKWLAESLQPVLPPQSNYTPRWNHIRACRYWCQSHWFDMSSAELQLTSQNGAMMQLRKLYWKTPIWEPIKTAAKRAESRLRSWIRSLPAT